MIELYVILVALMCLSYILVKGKNRARNTKIQPKFECKDNVQTIKVERKKVEHSKIEYLTSKTERHFYTVLQSLLPSEYIIHCQVSMMALVKPVSYKDNSKTWAKRMDYVITDRDTKILAVIELDDSSHRQKKRQERDLYVNSAFDGHHKLLRFEAQNSYDPIKIALVLENEVGIKCNTSESIPKYG